MTYLRKACGERPSVRVFAGTVSPSAIDLAIRVRVTANANGCKRNGWTQFSQPTFRNQWQCVTALQRVKVAKVLSGPKVAPIVVLVKSFLRWYLR